MENTNSTNPTNPNANGIAPSDKTSDGTGNSSANNTVAVFSTPACGYCKMVKDFLSEKNIKYVEYDVASDAAKRQEMFDKTHQMGVPVTQIGDDFIVGFDKGEMEKSLEKIK